MAGLGDMPVSAAPNADSVCKMVSFSYWLILCEFIVIIKGRPSLNSVLFCVYIFIKQLGYGEIRKSL